MRTRSDQPRRANPPEVLDNRRASADGRAVFGLSFWEIAMILAVALLVLGPTKLPELARSLGKGIREFRKATEDFKSTIDEEMHRPDPAPPPPKAIPSAGESTEPAPASAPEAEVVQAQPPEAPVVERTVSGAVPPESEPEPEPEAQPESETPPESDSSPKPASERVAELMAEMEADSDSKSKA
jgi:sec-independent protein translocase protein TatA